MTYKARLNAKINGAARVRFYSPELAMHDIVLKPGLVIAIEPMCALGTEKVRPLADGWTIVTDDMQPAAHYEHTVAVTVDGPWVLTAFED